MSRRLLVVAVVILAVLVLPFLIFGERFEAAFEAERSVEWLRSWGDWAWLAAVVLLSLDLVLPLPATVIFAALGLVYGPWLGGAIGAFGSILAGAIAYLSCRVIGPRAACVLLGGEAELERGRRLFSSVGGWAVAVSRCLPLVPEVVACLAGLVRMSARRFFVALACGSVPMAFAFAALGAMGADRPGLGLGLSLGLPVILWPIAAWWLGRSHENRTDATA